MRGKTSKCVILTGKCALKSFINRAVCHFGVKQQSSQLKTEADSGNFLPDRGIKQNI